MDRAETTGKNTRDTFKSVAIYVALSVFVAALYSYSVSLIAVQTPWINIVMGKASANTVLALILWTIFVEQIGKKKKWKPRTIWAMMMTGVLVLVMVVQMTPLN